MTSELINSINVYVKQEKIGGLYLLEKTDL